MTDQLNDIFSYIHGQLSELDQKREKILTASREIIRECSITIKHIHRNEIEAAEEKLELIKNSLKSLEEIRDLSLNADSNVMTAYQEYVEAELFLRFFKAEPMLSLQESKSIPILAYLHGLCDLVGELRRYCLEKLKNTSTFADAERALNYMEDIYDNLLSLDYPSGLIVGVRKKTDIARSIVEKTSGDMVLAYNRGKIEEKIDGFLKIIEKDKDR
ncbi:MAG: hypothetical protein ACXACX_09090 [Candidatus Hodarchaeales archaeon]|jgi:translin